MANVRIYRTYRYLDKNPVIDMVRTIVQDEKLFGDLQALHEISGVSKSTFVGWWHGGVRNPQHATIAATITALGYEEKFVKTRKIDVDKEREAGRAWLMRNKSKKKSSRKKK